MKNVMIVDAAENCAYDIFEFTEQQFKLIFPDGTDIAFIDEVEARNGAAVSDEAFAGAWERRVPKSRVVGIHGTLFYEMGHKKVYYPTRRDDEAVNPDGTRLR